MDFAFVPGISDYEDLLRRVLKARKNTTLISDPGIATIADFLQKLVSKSFQADDLVVGAHASERTFAIAFDTTTKVPANSNGKDYEMVAAVSAAGTIHIPPAIRKATTRFHIKGCDVGADQALPFLTLLKTALDNPQQVTAPKFLHALAPDADRGVFEYMKYEYSVINKTAFPDTQSLVTAFENGGFTQDVEAGGTPTAVPKANWTTWVKSTLDLAPATADEVIFDIPTRISPKIGKVGFINRRNAACSSRAETYSVTLPMGSQTIPPDDPARLALFRPALLADPRMQTTHPFPVYTRLGFADFNSFFNGLTWTSTVQGTNLLFVGSHFVYAVKIPVVKKSTSDLIFNYYPTSGAPVMHFAEDNASFKLFGTV